MHQTTGSSANSGDAVIEVYRANRGTLGKIREVETMIKRRQKER